MVNEDKIPEAPADGPVELESQFILRLPPVPAASLRATVASGVNLKDRLTIQIEPDVRHGKVRFDGWSLPAKIVDLPSIIECHKTLDKKTFYKTADICQMMICKEEVDTELSEVDTDGKGKQQGKDNKKFLYPHGITAPLKNVRKKRFRKTLRKKFVDVPEIEKEVKRLFKMDAEASHVRYEIVNADDEASGRDRGREDSFAAGLNNNSHSNLDIAEHDLFGEIVSSSDEDDTRAEGRDDDDSGDDSESAKFPSQKESSQSQAGPSTSFATEFTKEMLGQGMDPEASNQSMSAFDMSTETNNAAAAVAALEAESATDQENEGLVMKLKELEQEIRDLQNKRRSQEQEVAGIENLALRNRFQSLINSYKEQEAEKQRQYDDIYSMLNP